MKKLLKMIALFQAARHGGGYAARSHNPWKSKKWRGGKRHAVSGPYAGHPPYGHGPAHDPYGYGHGHRPRGLKGVLVEALVRRLLRR